MPTGPIMQDPDIATVAERLLAEGALSVRKLRSAVGGGDQSRLMRIVREVRAAQQHHDEQVAEASAFAGTRDADEADPERTALPEALRTTMSRLGEQILVTLHQARQEEADRGRAASREIQRTSEERIAAVQAERDEIAEDQGALLAEALDLRTRMAEALALAAELTSKLDSERERARESEERHGREARSFMGRIESLRADIVQAESEMRRLSDSLDRAKEDGRDAAARLESAEAEILQMRERVVRSEQAATIAHVERDHTEEMRRGLQAEVERLTVELREARSEAASAREMAASERGQVVALRENAAIMNETLSYLRAEATRSTKRAGDNPASTP
jgi:chromosome segregation ATPase